MSVHNPNHNPKIVVRVECYAGYRGEQTPRRMLFGARAVEVREVLDQWLAPDHRYFKLRGADGATYLLRHDTVTGVWELVMYGRGAPAADD
ncbi:MAG: hypothetical protein ACE5GS_14430 [Kiloniellaceae bacterium]